MSVRLAMRGVFSAVLTPFDSDLRPDAEKAIPYYRSLLERGCDGLNVLGTTGEAMSIGLADRQRFMERIAGAIPAQRLMTGTGASALADAAYLTRSAFDLGFAAALIIPPFYFRQVDDERIVRFFGELFDRAQPPQNGVLLYNFPHMSGITFHAALVERLVREFPGIIRGVKDSSNTIELEREIHGRCPDLDVFPGSESLLADARADGLAGCISGSVALWPELAARAWREGRPTDFLRLAELRRSLSGGPLIQVVRTRLAQESADAAWLRSIPPL